MGAWGLDFDENDHAADWLADFADEPDWELVDEALAVTDADYLDAPDASIAIAAVEVVAAGLGKASPRIDSELASWAKRGASEARTRRQTAILALGRVREDSELQEVWQESDEYEAWDGALEETLARL